MWTAIEWTGLRNGSATAQKIVAGSRAVSECENQDGPHAGRRREAPAWRTVIRSRCLPQCSVVSPPSLSAMSGPTFSSSKVFAASICLASVAWCRAVSPAGLRVLTSTWPSSMSSLFRGRFSKAMAASAGCSIPAPRATSAGRRCSRGTRASLMAMRSGYTGRLFAAWFCRP